MTRILEANYTNIPNIILEHWINVLSHTQLKVLLFLCRHTFGWQTVKKRVSLKFIAQALNFQKTDTVREAIRELEKYELVNTFNSINEDGGTSVNTYEIRVHKEQINPPQPTPLPPNDGGDPPPVLAGEGTRTPLYNIKEKDIKKIYSEDLLSFGDVVKMKSTEYNKFFNEYGKSYTEFIIQSINDYCLSQGKRYKDYAAAFRNFVKNDKSNKFNRGSNLENFKESVRERQIREKHNISGNPDNDPNILRF